MRTKLNKVTEWIKEIKDKKPLKVILKTFIAKLRGHINDYGVSHHSANVAKFIHEATNKGLNRRSQRKSFNGEPFLEGIKAHPLPRAKRGHRLF